MTTNRKSKGLKGMQEQTLSVFALLRKELRDGLLLPRSSLSYFGVLLVDARPVRTRTEKTGMARAATGRNGLSKLIVEMALLGSIESSASEDSPVQPDVIAYVPNLQ
jgi:hypothetical protein